VAPSAESGKYMSPVAGVWHIVLAALQATQLVSFCLAGLFSQTLLWIRPQHPQVFQKRTSVDCWCEFFYRSEALTVTQPTVNSVKTLKEQVLLNDICKNYWQRYNNNKQQWQQQVRMLFFMKELTHAIPIYFPIKVSALHLIRQPL